MIVVVVCKKFFVRIKVKFSFVKGFIWVVVGEIVICEEWVNLMFKVNVFIFLGFFV